MNSFTIFWKTSNQYHLNIDSNLLFQKVPRQSMELSAPSSVLQHAMKMKFCVQVDKMKMDVLKMMFAFQDEEQMMANGVLVFVLSLAPMIR